MKSKKIVISGTGCALADFLFTNISFNSKNFKNYLSKKSGDGGLEHGKLVFTKELEKFSGKPYQEILKEIIGNRSYDALNVGGPSIVSLIHASQLLNNKEYEVRFFGIRGKDETARKILNIIRKTPLNIKNYLNIREKATSFTYILSDPQYDNGHGERTFINNIGAAWNYSPNMLNDQFYRSNIVCFGGTALVPQIHDNLTNLLIKAKNNHCITVVNTVYDFRNEKINPGKPWPLVRSKESYNLIDILIMDCEEAIKISGKPTIEKASFFFTSTKLSSFIITNGANDMFIWSRGGIFEEQMLTRLPVSKKVIDDLKSSGQIQGDTTGCGDNFVGGIITSIAWQIKNKIKRDLDLIEAVSWGIASGGYCCFTVGGTYLEEAPGEKRTKVHEIQKEYIKQIGY